MPAATERSEGSATDAVNLLRFAGGEANAMGTSKEYDEETMCREFYACRTRRPL